MYENNFESALALFKKTINDISPLQDSDFENLAQVLHYKKYEKGEVLDRKSVV